MWLEPRSDERWPKIVASEKPLVVVWSSFWTARPRDTLRFEIESDGLSGSRLRWILSTPDDPPDEATLGRMRHRVNSLIDGEMRATFGQ